MVRLLREVQVIMNQFRNSFYRLPHIPILYWAELSVTEFLQQLIEKQRIVNVQMKDEALIPLEDY